MPCTANLYSANIYLACFEAKSPNIWTVSISSHTVYDFLLPNIYVASVAALFLSPLPCMCYLPISQVAFRLFYSPRCTVFHRCPITNPWTFTHSNRWAVYATVGLMLDCINSFTLIRQTLYVVSHFTCSRSAKHLQNTSAALTLVITSHV